MDPLFVIPGLVVTAIVGYVVAVTKELLPPPAEIAALVTARFHRPTDGTHFAVLVSKLQNDRDGRQTQHVFDALANIHGLDVLRTSQTLRLDSRKSEIEARNEADQRARKWLKRRNGDVAVWGHVSIDDSVLRLSFTGLGTASQRPESYRLQYAELPIDFSHDLEPYLIAAALVAVAAATESRGQFLVDILLPVAEKLENLLGGGGLQDHDGSLHHSLSLAFFTIGDQSGNSEFLTAAIAASRGALELSDRQKRPDFWASAQNNLGGALLRIGERENGTHLEEALTAFRAALEIWTQERVPLLWATVQNNLGLTLFTLGDREIDNLRLEQAVAAYQSGLEEQTQDNVPQDWATTQDNLGIALTSLGLREQGTERLEQAVTAFEAAFEIRSRELVPLLWAATQNNLGNALVRLGQRERSVNRFKGAVTAFKLALEEWTLDTVPLDWATAQDNLGTALTSYGQFERSEDLLQKAVTALCLALEIRKRDQFPLPWAATQNNLGTALAALGQIESGTKKLEQAVTAFESAIGILKNVNADIHVRGI